VSYLKLFNPLSPVMGGGDRYPEFMANMFPGRPTTAWLLSKAGAVALLAGALFGGIRLAQHVDKVDEISEEDNPAKKLKSQIGTTFAVPLNPIKKSAGYDGTLGPKQTIEFPASYDPIANLRNTGIPIAAFLLAGGGAWMAADIYADKKRNALMTKAIEGKSNTVRALMKLRARIARGLATDAEVKNTMASIGNDENYVKTAAQSNDDHPYIRGITTSMALLIAGLGIATGIGAYKYFSASDTNNLRYRAIKRGLKDYARGKTFVSPVSVIPQDADKYFKDLYDENEGKKSPRTEEDSLQPTNQISVTL